MVRDSINSIDPHLSDSSLHTGGGVIVDIGTGDGRFVYQSARKNPDKFFIGIDASPAGLAEMSAKINRKPARGGIANAIFVQAGVEELPVEFFRIADEVHVHFPWGSLLSALFKPDDHVLFNLRSICKNGALLEILTAIDSIRDRGELERLALSEIVGEDGAAPFNEYVRDRLLPVYERANLPIREHGFLPSSQWSKVCTSWGKRLAQGIERSGHYIVAEAV